LQIFVAIRKPLAYIVAMNTTNIELAGIKKYTVTELRTVAADDRHAVRDEALRRHELAAKKLAKLQKEVAELETLLKEVM